MLLVALGCSEERPAARVQTRACPERMALLADLGVCIDRHEAVVEGRGQGATAEPAEGRLPTTEISWFDSDRACRNAGFRLCTREEWQRACTGASVEGGRAFPYGDEYEQDRCNSAPDASSLQGRRLAPGGSHPRCVTPEGVFDLSGNLGEWLSSTDESGVLRELRGGSYANYPRPVHCVTTPLAFQPPESAFDGQGFRCCRDAS